MTTLVLPPKRLVLPVLFSVVTPRRLITRSELQPTSATSDQQLSTHLHPGTLTHTNINQLEQVQRSSAQYATGNYDYTSSVTQMLRDLHWPSLEQRCEHSRLITMMIRIYKQLTDIDFSSGLTLSQSATRGHKSCILQHSCNTNVYANLFFLCTICD